MMLTGEEIAPRLGAKLLEAEQSKSWTPWPRSLLCLSPVSLPSLAPRHSGNYLRPVLTGMIVTIQWCGSAEPETLSLLQINQTCW